VKRKEQGGIEPGEAWDYYFHVVTCMF